MDGLAEKDELVAQLKQQIAATEYLKEQEDENNGELQMYCSVFLTMWLLVFVAFISYKRIKNNNKRENKSNVMKLKSIHRIVRLQETFKSIHRKMCFSF